MALHEYCIPKAILPELEAADKEDAIRQLIDALVDAKALTRKKGDAIAKEIIDRERQATTGIGNGVGIPHARSKHVKVLVLLVSPKDDTDEHLAAMKSIVNIVRDGYQCKRLIGCRSAESFVDLLKELDGA